MLTLGSLRNTSKQKKKIKRVGRGLGSGLGKTCGRGEKGAGSRSGYKRRFSYEGGQFRMFMKMPIRGFNNAHFRKEYQAVNLDQIEKMFSDGDVVTRQSLVERLGRKGPFKLLGNGELSKKVTFQLDAISNNAKEKLHRAKIKFEMPVKA